MGYSTDFDGAFRIDPPLTAAHVAELNDFAAERHDDAKFPSHYCQWVPNADGAGLQWDGGEKFYDYTEWLRYIVEQFLKPWGYILNGEVKWQGEQGSDFGMLVVRDNVVTAREGKQVYE